MLDAIEPFKANGKAMTDALTRLEQETTTVGALLGEAARRLAGDRDDIGTSLQDAIADIESLAAGIGGADGLPPGCDDMLDVLAARAPTRWPASGKFTRRFSSEAESAATRQGVDAGRRRPYAGDEPIEAAA